jgi:hypothetical protein
MGIGRSAAALLFGLGVASWTPSARADVAPPPARPVYWDQEPPPMPEPPPEKELEIGLLMVGVAIGLARIARLEARRRVRQASS